jgi:aerobic carbon-monoxide dehydrogenase small subunit
MTSVRVTINGREVSADVEPRVHLADFLRDHRNLTATHLRCEQGACGACTVLIDGQPARSCITYAVMCDGAVITTIEGLADDTVMAALRRAFSEEHGLQCGFCTPGMLVTARDIITRLPDADQARVRTELSGNLCRCTGYVGIVRAITRVLDERRRGEISDVEYKPGPLGPVGARRAGPVDRRVPIAPAAPTSVPHEVSSSETVSGLGGRQPNVEIRQSFVLSRPPAEVWTFFAEIARVVPCLPGARLTRPPADEQVEGQMTVKLGPITANFAGQARIERDESRRRGTIMGTGRDQSGGSRAAGEVEYVVEATADGGTRVALTIRVLLVGPLAQFGRGAIIEDLLARITETFARNLEARLTGAVAADDSSVQAPLDAGSLVGQIIWARVKTMVASLFGGRKD